MNLLQEIGNLWEFLVRKAGSFTKFMYWKAKNQGERYDSSAFPPPQSFNKE